jgi:hypothetical protein
MHHEFQTDNPLDSFIGVWRRVVTEPRSFFQDMPVSGGLQQPVLFLLICLAISSLGFLVLGPRPLAFWFLVIGLVRSFVGALVLVLIARNIFSGGGDYEATYRAVAYASAPAALLWVPFIRPLVGLYTLFLLIIGLERVQGFDAVKSVLTLLLAALTLFVLGWVLGIYGWLMPMLMPLIGRGACG